MDIDIVESRDVNSDLTDSNFVLGLKKQLILTLYLLCIVFWLDKRYKYHTRKFYNPNYYPTFRRLFFVDVKENLKYLVSSYFPRPVTKHILTTILLSPLLPVSIKSPVHIATRVPPIYSHADILYLSLFTSWIIYISEILLTLR